MNICGSQPFPFMSTESMYLGDEIVTFLAMHGAVSEQRRRRGRTIGNLNVVNMVRVVYIDA